MTLLAAASGPPDFLPQVVALVVAAAAVGYLCVRVRVVPIVGFLLAGVLIGPDALRLVTEREVVDAAAEVGVILLLFTIGIEFSLERLARIRRLVLLGGSVQVLATVALVTGLLVLGGVDVRPAVFTGFLVSLSSTAIVLKLLGDRGETSGPTGSAAVAMLVFQDLAVVLMVLLVPVLAGGDGASPAALARALGTAAAVVALVLVVARRVMPVLLEAVARACSPEVFLLSVIALCLGTAYLTALAGVSVSLGAFLAGLVVSESRHSVHALGEVLPLQVLFSAVFFLSVGTLLDVRFLVREPLLVLAAVALVLVVKVLTTALAARVVGTALPTTAALALLLAQVGEFAFVLERAGREQGLTPAGLGEDGSQAFVAATVVLLVATPSLAGLGRRLAVRLGRRPQPAGRGAAPPPSEATGHVVVSGWGDGARAVVPELAGQHVVLVTLNPDGAREAEALGLEVVRGDSTRELVLHEARVDRARMVVVADDDAEQAARITAAVRRLAPSAQVLVRAGSEDDVAGLAEAGADRLVLDGREAQRALARATATALVDGPAAAAPTRADPSRLVRFSPAEDAGCVHLAVVRPVVPVAEGCVACLRTGDPWVHLRLCLTCGHVGCCDSSPGTHAARHAAAHEHPLMASLEPGEGWGWCYLDDVLLAPPTSSRTAP